jgi:WD40 repeat protein
MSGRNLGIALDKFTTFGDLLRFLRRRAGLTQREFSIAVGYSDAQVSRLELNQRPPDLATVSARFIPALALDEVPEAAARLLELASGMRRDDAPASGLPPFKGLHYFDEGDADLFFGRETLVTQLVDRLHATRSTPHQARFLAIIGASGTGKSSLVRAGLVPTLRWSSPAVDWLVESFTPTAHPLWALATAVHPEGAPRATVATLAAVCARNPEGLRVYADRLRDQSAPAGRSQSQGPQRLLVVDQFEEIFSLCRDENERRAFIDNLVTAALEPHAAIFMLLTLRADFYAHCAPYAALRDVLSNQQVYIGPMSGEELRRAIEEPAKRAGWELEPGLVEVLLNDIGADRAYAAEPGALPLLSHALLETWHRRRGRTLTVSGYLASGGVRGAIAETAEAVFHDELDARQQAIARNIFLRLTELGEDNMAAETRRRATYEELGADSEDAPTVRYVLTRLADARLITTEAGTAEVAHEALIREWPTLRGWLEENREALRLHRHLTLAAEAWARQGRDPSELYRGARLAQATEWADANAGAVNALECEFLKASNDQDQAEAAEREAQRQRELEAARQLAQVEKQRAELQTRAATQLRRRALYLAGAFILALLMAGTAVIFEGRARQSAIAAEHERRLALSRELASAAISNLPVDPERSVLLALEAINTTYNVDRTWTSEAETALHEAILASRVQLSVPLDQGEVTSMAFSPLQDAKQVATASRDGTVKLWDTTTGQIRLLLAGPAPGAVNHVAFSADGLRLATASDDGRARVWDAKTGLEMLSLAGHSDSVTAVAFSPDGRHLATASADGTVIVWDAQTGNNLLTLADHAGWVTSLAFMPDGTRVVMASYEGEGQVRVLDIEAGLSGDEIRDDNGSAVEALRLPGAVVAVSPDGTRLAGILADASVAVWDAQTGDQLLSLRGHTNVRTSVGFSPDGTRLFTTSLDRKAIVWDAITGEQLLTLAGHSQPVFAAAFSPDGLRLATASADETLRVWDLAPSREALTLFHPPGNTSWFALSPDGRRLVLTGEAAAVPTVWELAPQHGAPGEIASVRALFDLEGHTDFVRGLAFSRDGTRIATGSFDGTAKVWDTATGREVLALSDNTGPVHIVEFSPDGQRLATASDDLTAKVWGLDTGELLLTLIGHKAPILNIKFSSDGQLLATGDDAGQTIIWEAGTGRSLFELIHSGTVFGLDFSPDGTLLATATSDGTAKIWRLTTLASGEAAVPQERFTLAGHTSTIVTTVFSPDGARLATASRDGTVRLWDVDSGREVLTLYGSGVGLCCVAFSGDGAHLFTGGDDGVRAYVMSIEELMTLAKRRVTRALSVQECHKYLHRESCPEVSAAP